ncbi:MAG: phospholipase [Pseudomonadota bacterium]
MIMEAAMAVQPYLQARPFPPSGPAPTGNIRLPTGGKGDCLAYIPHHYQVSSPLPMVLLLHGAGGSASEGMALLQDYADEPGLILVAPASTGRTWDIIFEREYGSDLALIDTVLEHMFREYAIDTGHVGIGGFSDGASYALTLGLANGDLFSHILAYSPGFIGPITARGDPQIFISHGNDDEVLPVQQCSRNIVRRLTAFEYRLVYEEFDGAHVIPRDVADASVRWFISGNAGR